MRSFTAIIGMLAVAHVGASHAATVANEPSISADAALAAAHAALEACRKDGQKVAVSVVDAAGRLKAQIRDDGASPHTPEHSFRKAYTALTYREPSAEVGKRAAQAKGLSIGPLILPNMTTAAGGVPVKADGATIGAVGVSGTPGSAGGGEHDAKCAAAGVEAAAK